MSDVICTICYDNLVEEVSHDDSKVRATNCGHLFHSGCLSTWMNE